MNLVFFVPFLSTEELRKLSWSGIPKPVRPITWKLLSVSVRGPPPAQPGPSVALTLTPSLRPGSGPLPELR